MKNTMYTVNIFIQLISLSQKGYFIVYNENKIALCLKKGCFIRPQNRRFPLKRFFFFVQNPRKGGVFQAYVRAWYTFWWGVGGRDLFELYMCNVMVICSPVPHGRAHGCNKRSSGHVADAVTQQPPGRFTPNQVHWNYLDFYMCNAMVMCPSRSYGHAPRCNKRSWDPVHRKGTIQWSASSIGVK